MNTRVLSLVTLVFLFVDPQRNHAQSIDPSPYTGDLYDIHCHYSGGGDPLLADYGRILRGAGITEALLLCPPGGPYSTVVDGHTVDPAVFGLLPAGMFHFSLAIPSSMFGSSSTLAWAQSMVSTYPFAAFGEISLRHQPTARLGFPADHPWTLGLNRIGPPCLEHFEAPFRSELVNALTASPAARIVWAHAGDAESHILRSLMATYPNLYLELSCRHPYYSRAFPLSVQSMTDSLCRLKPGWQALLEDYQDRIMWGSDVGKGMHRFPLLNTVVTYYRRVFGQLSPSAAYKISYGNAKGLF